MIISAELYCPFENAVFVISNEVWRSEKSVKSATCGSKISRLRLEMTVLRQPPGATGYYAAGSKAQGHPSKFVLLLATQQ